MKKIMLSLAVVATVLTACKSEKKEAVKAKEEVKVEQVTVTNNVNLETSSITWKGTKPVGDAHNGTIALKQGTLIVENNDLKGGEFIIDMNSIKNLDIKNAEYAGKLEGHLKNADFFDVEKYPTSKFVIATVEKTDNGLNITGNLTVKDVTKSITVPATLSQENGVATLKSTTFSINRADFNVKYNSKSFFDIKELKDKAINDLVEISFEVKTKA